MRERKSLSIWCYVCRRAASESTRGQRRPLCPLVGGVNLKYPAGGPCVLSPHTTEGLLWCLRDCSQPEGGMCEEGHGFTYSHGTVGGRGEVNSWYRQGKGREGRGSSPPNDKVQEDSGQGSSFLQSWVYERRDGKERAEKRESVRLFQD